MDFLTTREERASKVVSLSAVFAAHPQTNFSALSAGATRQQPLPSLYCTLKPKRKQEGAGELRRIAKFFCEPWKGLIRRNLDRTDGDNAPYMSELGIVGIQLTQVIGESGGCRGIYAPLPRSGTRLSLPTIPWQEGGRSCEGRLRPLSAKRYSALTT